MSNQRKTGVTAVFLTGLLTLGASVARMYTYLGTSYDKEDNPDFIGKWANIPFGLNADPDVADFTLFILWSEIEANTGMLCSCMPTLVPVLVRIKTHLTAGSEETLFSKRSNLWKARKNRSIPLDSIDELTYGRVRTG